MDLQRQQSWGWSDRSVCQRSRRQHGNGDEHIDRSYGPIGPGNYVV